MWYGILFIFGVVVGAACVLVIVMELRSQLARQKKDLEARQAKLRAAIVDSDARQKAIEDQASLLRAQQDEFAARKIAYDELRGENGILKRDLQNIHVELSKLQLDRQRQREKQETLDERANELGSRYLKESVKWLVSSVNANNFAACKQRLLAVIERCRGIGFDVSADEEASLVADLKAEFEKAVRAALEREEQARIKAQIREEQQREREIDRELKQLDRERAAIQAALDKALAEARDQHSEEIERLRSRLAEAEAKAQRTVSQAQLTKSGHVYVISNVGAFGTSVFKIGMTRRLDPHDRVRELGDASVPFPFDVHMMISCNDAPRLENELHRAFHQTRLNKVNPRKEFFKVDIQAIRKVVEENHGQVDYVADPEALEYHQSMEMSDEDSAYIDTVFEKTSDEIGIPADEE